MFANRLKLREEHLIFFSIFLYFIPQEFNPNLYGNFNISDMTISLLFVRRINIGFFMKSEDKICLIFLAITLISSVFHTEIELIETAIQYFLCFFVLKKVVESKFNELARLTPKIISIIAVLISLGLISGYVFNNPNVLANFRFIHTFGNANGLGSTLSLLLTLALVIKWENKLFFYFSILALGLGLIATLSFGSYILTILLLIALKGNKNLLVFSLIFSIGTYVFITQTTFLENAQKKTENRTVLRLINRIDNLSNGEVGSSDVRIWLVDQSLENIGNNLFKGVGYKNSFHGINVVHNQYLLLSEQFGVLSSLTFLIFLLIFLWNSSASFKWGILWFTILLFLLSTKTHYYSRIFYSLLYLIIPLSHQKNKYLC